jgi:hypothetical protein
VLLKLPLTGTQRPLGPVVHYNKRWDIAAANHVAHGNATPLRSANEQYACGSNASRVLEMADEIICFSLDPNRNVDGSLDVLVVAPVMTDLDATGGGLDEYSKMPKGNVDVTGEYFIWTTNMGGNRLDAFLVKIPGHLLKASDPSSIHVADLDRTAVSLAKGYWRATVDVLAHDGSHAPIAGATISGSWSGGHAGPATCITDTTGRCSMASGSIPKSARTATLTITDMLQASLSYDATANHDPDGDSNGTGITARKP